MNTSVFNKHYSSHKYIYNTMTLIQSFKNFHFHRQSVYCNASQNILENDHPAALHLSFIESSFFLQYVVDADLVECDPHTVTSTPAFFNTFTHHLEMFDVVMRLWGLTYQGIFVFPKVLSFLIYCSRWLATQIFWSGYLKSTIGSRWFNNWFNNSGTKIVTLSPPNIIKSIFI